MALKYGRKGCNVLIHMVGNRFYDLQPTAYGYCKTCDCVYDAWRYENPSVCPNCKIILNSLQESSLLSERTRVTSLRMCLEQCEEDGCFGEGFAYPVPLRPTLLIKHGGRFTDEYGGQVPTEQGDCRLCQNLEWRGKGIKAVGGCKLGLKPDTCNEWKLNKAWSAVKVQKQAKLKERHEKL